MKTKEYFDEYQNSPVSRICLRCNKPHGVCYKIIKDGVKRLSMVCKSSKPKTQYIKFEEDLNIPTIGCIKH